MNKVKAFQSSLAADILDYISLKQALGRRFDTPSRVLLSLDLGGVSPDESPGNRATVSGMQERYARLQQARRSSRRYRGRKDALQPPGDLSPR